LFTEGTGPANTVTGKGQLATVEKKACGEFTYHCRTVRRLCKGEIASFGVLRGGIFCNLRSLRKLFFSTCCKYFIYTNHEEGGTKGRTYFRHSVCSGQTLFWIRVK
jgi:hypothetical protein